MLCISKMVEIVYNQMSFFLSGKIRANYRFHFTVYESGGI